MCTLILNFYFVFSSQSYKRVGGQKHNADMGRGVIGVADITDLIVYFQIYLSAM